MKIRHLCQKALDKSVRAMYICDMIRLITAVFRLWRIRLIEFADALWYLWMIMRYNPGD